MWDEELSAISDQHSAKNLQGERLHMHG